jgi:peptide/nickel transport system substrate-binding protein
VPKAILPSPSQTVDQYQPEAARQEGGTLTIGDWESPSNFAPLFNDELPAAQVNAALYAGLIRLDPKLRWVPDLASRVPTLANGDVRWNRGAGSMDVTYRLRPGLRWSDGQPITARDVAFTWRVIVDPRVQGVISSAGYDAISRIDVKDDVTLTLYFDRLYPKYLTLFPAVLPEHRLGTIPLERLARDAFWSRPDVVSGPYKISELLPDERITLVRNAAWSEGRQGRRPHLDTIVYKLYPEVAQLIEAARAGEVDVALEIPDDQLGGLSQQGQTVPLSRSGLAYEQVTFNQADPNPLTGQPPPWKDDSTLLQALRLGVDRKSMISSLLAGKARPADSPIPSAQSAFHDPQVAFTYDLEKAQQLLDQDGWVAGPDGIRSKAGRRLSFSITTTVGNALRLRVRERLIADWRKLGVDVSAKDARPSQMFSGYAEGGMLERGQFEAGLWTWSIGPDPDGAYPVAHSSQIPSDQNQGRGSNFGRFKSSEIDSSLDKGRYTLLPLERSQAYQAFQRAYLQLGGELPLYERVVTVLAKQRVHNLLVNPAPDTTLWNVADWWLES